MAGSGIERRRDEVLGLTMHARVAGPPIHAAGPDSHSPRPIVLVHGLVVSSAFLEPAMKHLGIRQPAYAPDLPGFGHSTKPAQAFDLPHLALYLGSWMDRLGLRQATLVGCSLGTQIVSHLALQRPELVERAVLMSPTMDPAARSRLVSLWRGLRELPYELPMVPLMLRDYARAGIRRALSTYAMTLADRPEERLPSMHMPTLVLRGELDPLVPQSWAEQVARLLPNGRLQVVPGQAHAFNFSAPELFARLVEEFASRPQPGRRRSAA